MKKHVKGGARGTRRRRRAEKAECVRLLSELERILAKTCEALARSNVSLERAAIDLGTFALAPLHSAESVAS